MNDPATYPADVFKEEPSRHILSKVAIEATTKHNYTHITIPFENHIVPVRKNW